VWRENCERFCFYCNLSAYRPDFNTHAFGHCVIFFGQKGHRSPKFKGAPTPMMPMLIYFEMLWSVHYLLFFLVLHIYVELCNYNVFIS